MDWEESEESEEDRNGFPERPLTSCPECGGEIDLTYANDGDQVVCVVCGAELVVVSLDPPELASLENQ